MTRKIFLTGALVVSLFVHIPSVAAAIVFGDVYSTGGEPQTMVDNPPEALTRGEAVAVVIDSFDLRKKFASFVRDCLQNPDECFFVFSTMSDYDGIQFTPLILYPDVYPAHLYYRAINTATMLGLVHGYLEEENSPFHPESRMTRIQALKVVLGAADLMKWKDKFEMTDADYPADLPFGDPEIKSEDGWWYARYLSFALERGLIDSGEAFEPDRGITGAELNNLVARTLDFIPATANTQTDAEQIQQ